MKIVKVLFYLPLCFVLIFASCTKVIDINLNASSPKLIIEGSINDQANSCMVSLSKSVNYNESNTFPTVSDAIITISDNLGNATTLTETSPGVYTDIAFQGVASRVYTLTVNSEGITYTGISEMPAAVSIDSIAEDSVSGGFFGQGNNKTRKFVEVSYFDPPGVVNFYRFVEVINHKTTNNIMVSSDELRDGNYITRRIGQRDSTLVKGDTVTIRLQSIDKPVYNYFDQLDQTLSTGFGGLTATPANPVSNIDNGALGYFNAYSVREKKIVIK